MFSRCTCDDEHLFFQLLWNTARDTTSLSRQTKKHWLKIRNAQCFPAFAPLAQSQHFFTAFSIFPWSNHTNEGETFEVPALPRCESFGVCWRFSLLSDTQTHVHVHERRNLVLLASHCDFKDSFQVIFSKQPAKTMDSFHLIQHFFHAPLCAFRYSNVIYLQLFPLLRLSALTCKGGANQLQEKHFAATKKRDLKISLGNFLHSICSLLFKSSIFYFLWKGDLTRKTWKFHVLSSRSEQAVERIDAGSRKLFLYQ